MEFDDLTPKDGIFFRGVITGCFAGVGAWALAEAISAIYCSPPSALDFILGNADVGIVAVIIAIVYGCWSHGVIEKESEGERS